MLPITRGALSGARSTVPLASYETASSVDRWHRRGPSGGDHRAWLRPRVGMDGVGQGQSLHQENALGLATALDHPCGARWRGALVQPPATRARVADRR